MWLLGCVYPLFICTLRKGLIYILFQTKKYNLDDSESEGSDKSDDMYDNDGVQPENTKRKVKQNYSNIRYFMMEKQIARHLV